MRFGINRTPFLEEGNWVKEASSGLLGTSELSGKLYKAFSFLGWMQTLLPVTAAKEGEN